MICEERANRKFVNCEVVNSYYVGQDGKHFWFEVIMATPELLLHDHRFQHLVNQKGRVFRGLTSAGKRMRGMRWKGKGAEKSR